MEVVLSFLWQHKTGSHSTSGVDGAARAARRMRAWGQCELYTRQTQRPGCRFDEVVGTTTECTAKSQPMGWCWGCCANTRTKHAMHTHAQHNNARGFRGSPTARRPCQWRQRNFRDMVQVPSHAHTHAHARGDNNTRHTQARGSCAPEMGSPLLSAGVESAQSALELRAACPR